MSEKASNLYVPDYQAWEKFFENRAKKERTVGLGFKTEEEAIKHQQQDVVLSGDRSRICEQAHQEPKIVSVVSPTEQTVQQTVQQAESVMKKAGVRVKNKCSSKKKARNNPSKKTKTQKKRQGKTSKTFSYRTLSDIFSKRK